MAARVRVYQFGGLLLVILNVENEVSVFVEQSKTVKFDQYLVNEFTPHAEVFPTCAGEP
jgi:hypothetical protein